MLKIGDVIPEFLAKDFSGDPLVKEDLLGAPFVIYFYPKNNTPGCTQEACEFRDVMDGLEDLNVMVVGVSPDSPDSHQKFIEEHGLNFPLISDEKKEVAAKFGVIKPEGGIIRSTFLCDEEGVVQWMESPVTLNGHIDRVLEAIEEIFE
jgi:peroxiredoxin Q/BCP